MTNLLFDTPWWLPVVLAVAGVAMFISGNARQKLAVRNGGIAVLLLTIGLMAMSYFVDTDREMAIQRSRELVAAVDKQDWTRLSSLLDPRSSFNKYGNREELTEGARRSAEQFGLKSASVLTIDAKQTDSLITVDLVGMSVQSATMDRPLNSVWQMDWQKSRDGWVLKEIRLLRIGNRDISDVGARLPDAR